MLAQIQLSEYHFLGAQLTELGFNRNGSLQQKKVFFSFLPDFMLVHQAELSGLVHRMHLFLG